MTNLQNAILEAYRDDILTSSESSMLLESCYYKIPLFGGFNSSKLNTIKIFIEHILLYTKADYFAISVQKTDLPDFNHKMKITSGVIRNRSTMYLGIPNEKTDTVDFIAIDTDDIANKTNHPFNGDFVKDFITFVGDMIPEDTNRKYDGCVFFGTSRNGNIASFNYMNHYINGSSNQTQILQIAGGMVKLDRLFIEK